MRNFLCYAILLCLVLTNCSICGCIGDYNTRSATSTPKYQEGDIVSINSTFDVGFVIINYNPVNDSYFSRPIFRFTNGSWGYYHHEELGKEFDRITVENVVPFKAYHVSNLNAIPSVKTDFALLPITENNIRIILLENEEPKIQNLDNIIVNGTSVEITQHYSNYWLAYTFFYHTLKVDTKMMEILFENPNVEKCTFDTTIDTTDEYGNKEKKVVLKISVNRNTHEKINYDNFDPENLWKIADYRWRDPSISRDLGLSTSQIIAEQILYNPE